MKPYTEGALKSPYTEGLYKAPRGYLQSPMGLHKAFKEKGLYKAPIGKGLCKGPSVSIHTYIHM